MVHQFFDYTVQDPNVLFAIALLMGIIQKSSYNIYTLQTNRFKKLTIPVLFILMIPIWILNTNHKQSLVLQENYRISNFQELIQIEPLDQYVFEQSLFLDSLTYGFYLDDRMAMLSGIVNMEYSFISGENSKEFAERSKSRIEICKNLNPYNPICNQLVLNPPEFRKS
jgi:hypothetical protein